MNTTLAAIAATRLVHQAAIFATTAAPTVPRRLRLRWTLGRREAACTVLKTGRAPAITGLPGGAVVADWLKTRTHRTRARTADRLRPPAEVTRCAALMCAPTTSWTAARGIGWQCETGGWNTTGNTSGMRSSPVLPAWIIPGVSSAPTWLMTGRR